MAVRLVYSVHIFSEELKLDCANYAPWVDKEEFEDVDGEYETKCIEKEIKHPEKAKVIRCMCKDKLCNGASTAASGVGIVIGIQLFIINYH